MIDLFVASTYPFVCGWWTDAKFNLILLSLQKFFIAFPANCVSLSVMIWMATPNLQIMFLKTNFTAFSWVIDLTGYASAHFVKYSTATKAYFLPLLVTGNGPIISRPHLANGTAVLRDISLTDGRCCIFPYFWHSIHFLTISCGSNFIVGQKYPYLDTCWYNFLPPWWEPPPPLWMLIAISFSSSFVTHVLEERFLFLFCIILLLVRYNVLLGFDKTCARMLPGRVLDWGWRIQPAISLHKKGGGF